MLPPFGYNVLINAPLLHASRYNVLGRQLPPELGDKEKSMAIVKQHSSGAKEWQLGKTKVRVHMVINCYSQVKGAIAMETLGLKMNVGF